MATSTLGMIYPSLRDHPIKTGFSWLEGKRKDDGAEGLWRIHNGLYNLEDFIPRHPGGSQWIVLTKGTDITEAFETHHLKGAAEKLLPKFFVRKANSPRNSPFTFHEHGFYRTLKRAAIEELKTIKKSPIQRSKLLADSMMSAFLVLALLAAYSHSYTVGMLSGIILGLTAIAAHNFFHQKDNFRMHYFDFTFMSSTNWRISHALSHHLFTNTINDFEVAMTEPFIYFLPQKKSVFLRFASWIYSPVIYSAFVFSELFKEIIDIMILKRAPVDLFMALPLSVFALMAIISGDVVASFKMFLWIEFMAGLHFAAIGVNAAHHHPDIFHDGDTPRPKEERDWGIHQLDAVMDRTDITGSHFLVLTNFGDHALHHMFPTLDHGLLDQLYPVFLRVCNEFGAPFKMTNQVELVKGQFRQLAKIEPKKTPPTPLKRTTKAAQD